MKKINIDIMNETLYVKTLTNGFKIYMFPDKRVNKYYVTLTTKYGSIHDEFVPQGHSDMMKFPSGIAHFLEHQMFEHKEGRNLDELFEANGAKINAFTSHECTSYLFAATEHVKENIALLLELVYNLNITNDTVNKEKGIIVQEIKMYDDKPSSRFHDEISSSLFINDKRNQNVGGIISDVESITKEQLELCYNTFYQPSNMFMIVTGNFEIEDVLNTVEPFMNEKECINNEIVIKEIYEPKEVATKYKEVKMSQAETPKLAIVGKVYLADVIKKYGIASTRSTLNILLRKLFGPTSILNDELVTNGITNTDLAIDSYIAGDYAIGYVICETNNKDQVVDKVTKELSNISISDEDFSIIKKMFISSAVRTFINIEGLNERILSLNIDGYELKEDYVSFVKDFKKETYDEIVKEFDFSNFSVVYLTKE